jgi:hypothetical protein
LSEDYRYLPGDVGPYPKNKAKIWPEKVNFLARKNALVGVIVFM